MEKKKKKITESLFLFSFHSRKRLEGITVFFVPMSELLKSIRLLDFYGRELCSRSLPLFQG